MTKILQRISVGKMDNGKWMHDHYASPEERDWIRPNADGVGVDSFGSCYDEAWEPEVYKDDVSDTHRIEYGIETGSKNGTTIEIYDGDIYVDWNTGVEGVCSVPQVFDILRNASHLSFDEWPMIEIIGNIHTNPDMMKGKWTGNAINPS